MTATFLSTAGVSPMPAVSVTAEQRSRVFMCASLLLGYPGARWEAELEAVAAAAADLPGELREPFDAFVGWARSRQGVERAYVETFDDRRRCCLNLSYYAVGDTRQRGAALLSFRELFKACGVEQTSGELPDFLPIILELAATHADDPIAQSVLPAHREGLEILRAALSHLRSPWGGVVEAVTRVLPPVDEATTQRYLRLLREGPPAELVGINDLTPFPIGPNQERS